MAPAVHGYFWGNVLTGALRAAAAHGDQVTIIQTFDAGFVDYPDGNRFPAHLAWDHIDALIAGQAAVTDAYLREFVRTGKPAVAVFRKSEDFPGPTVVPDNHDGVRQAIDHLVGHGHTSIGFVCRHWADADEWLRYRAYREILLARGLKPAKPVLVSWRLDETYDATSAVRDLRDRGPLPTAVLVCTDLVALAFIEALTRGGIAVPDDIAVIGFDDIADAATHRPSLSTVSQSFVLAGTTAYDLAFQAIEGSTPLTGYHRTPVSLVVRRSCGCAEAPTCLTVQPTPGFAQVRDQLVDELTEIVYSGRHLIASERDDLLQVVDNLTALLGRADRPEPTPEMVSDDSPLAEVVPSLRQLAILAPNPSRLVGTIRRFAIGLAKELYPGSASVEAWCERLAFDLAIHLLESESMDGRGRPVARRDVETQRRYYMIGTNLVRQREMTPHSLDWLADTEFHAGCLAVWDSGRGNPDGGTLLRVVSSYDRTGQCPIPSGVRDVTEFPPPLAGSLVDESTDDSRYWYVLPVRFAGSDWGFLALVGSLDLREEAAFERYNHWAVLLTVALDHEHAIRSERRLLEEIRTSEERYALAAEAANDGLWDWNLASGTVFYSSRWKALLGCDEDQIPATSEAWLDRIHPDHRPEVDRRLAEHVDGRVSTMELEYQMRASDGSYRWMLTHSRSMCDKSGRVVRLIGSMTDITDRRLREERLRRDAYHDPLTGLPNRVLFLRCLAQAIDTAHRRPGRRFAVVFLDLDGFKVINDTLGHQTGDEVLIAVAARLVGQLPTPNTVARFGGDEFVLLLDNPRDPREVRSTVARVLSAISAPLTIGGQALAVSAAAGVAMNADRRQTPEEYLRTADLAMYQAKAAGTGNVAMFDPPSGG